jgi:hypothetical protein
MEIPIWPGEWIQALSFRMGTAEEGSCFLLPSLMHLHAFEIAKQTQFPKKEFRVRVASRGIENG